MAETTGQFRVWCIGPDGTEYYAARSRSELRKMYVGMVGEKQTDEDFSAHCEEVAGDAMDVEMPFDDDGERTTTTWRKLTEGLTGPCQISTGYN